MNWIGLQTFIERELHRMFQVTIQTLVTPWISALLFIFIFGSVVGSKIDLIAGVSYIKFVLPGILAMNVLSSAFAHSSSSLYMHRFIRTIEEILVAPLSHFEIILGYVTGALVRGVVVGLGILFIGILFGATEILHPGLFLFYLVSVSVTFALLGLLVGLWSKNFEQLTILNVFVITPLSFLGGMFNSVTMLPPAMQAFTHINPIFYFIDGIRYSMIGVHESNLMIGVGIILVFIIALWTIVELLFKSGWRLRV